jgi:23S rRNA (adenine2503-C2)-methyltransferase
MFDRSTRAAIDAFRDALMQRGLVATVRLTRGREIAAACGQLAATPRPSNRAYVSQATPT